MLNYQLFPRSNALTTEIRNVIDCFTVEYNKIDSAIHNLKSDEVLKIIAPHLIKIGFTVETGKYAANAAKKEAN